MTMPFELMLALRYLKPQRTFVSIITLISVLGVTLGVAVLIIVTSVMSGFDHDLRGRILGFNTPLRITREDAPMTNYEAVAQTVSSNQAVTGISPYIFGPILMETEGTTNKPALQDAPMMRGIDPVTEGKVSNLPQDIIAGQFDLNGRGLLIGLEMAKTFRLNVGDHVSLYSIKEIQQMKEAAKHKTDVAVLPDEYEVRGIFDTGYYEYNARVLVTSLENAQDLYAMDDSVHGLFVSLKDPDQAALVKEQLSSELDTNLEVTTWMEQNSSILSAIQVEKNVMFYLLFFIVLVAALGILSAQITFVIQKTREIGVLKALGATRTQISSIFLAQSAIIGSLGVTCGYGLGILAVNYRNEFLHFMRHATGWQLFPASIYGFGELPALVSANDLIIICSSSFALCILGGLLPAIRAGRLEPVKALRHE